ncbi:pyridoxamine 5'-phosphate oxidase family protein [Hydrogenovibrio sp. 3SP14C1]|uniref:HugZ family pyridoxamine 5'-phosphate oxidase n=1 Tax=Hydrogenovibrio sp. 3SP14C1 TaxID=3038774 RepID=UPI0024163B2C|nr:pyridoxamine 5'-phosphate oxidase family protein [Hydrogenovibrio sp. 3SP14C1]MDG4813249.1 pyridoxamine 5'-phosphate oxidase family protein [Hydrogenovibrio sp. 3SP14C1]
MPQPKFPKWSKTTYQSCAALIQSQQSLLLSTLGELQTPNASYAPFIQYQEAFYIFVSGLAEHTQNLLNHPQASLLIMEGEKEAGNIFARQRIQLQVNAFFISREDAHWESRLEAFESKFGDLILTLKALPDFHLFQLSPISGRYIKGFGQAYPLASNELKTLFSLVNQSVN